MAYMECLGLICLEESVNIATEASSRAQVLG